MKKAAMVFSTVMLIMTMAHGAARAGDFCAVPVETGQGAFAGMSDVEYEACVFRGIPFAKPPVGDLRLKEPQPPEPHDGLFEAFNFGAACTQKPDMMNGGEAEEYGEDCLYLNVYRPEKSGTFPVMVWIYGGGFVGGSGSFDIYDGSHLVSREDVVVVTLNYRLGALGFMALPELKEDSEIGSTGNYGILDQIRALNWVKENIEAFGGDPDNVTVFGQSAGGMSICTLMASPLAEGLFDKAMIMSAPCRLMTELDDGYKKSRSLAEKMGCSEGDVVECLREKPKEAFDIKGNNDLFSGGVAWSPTIDGTVLPDMPVKRIQEGNYNKVPTIIGTTKDELRIYTLMVPGLGLWPKSSVNSLLKGLTGPENYADLMSMYDYKDYRRPIDLAFAFGNQMVFETPSFLLAEAISKDQPVYIYRFDWNKTRFPHKLGAFHAVDVPFVFGALDIDADIARLLASKKTYDKAKPLAYTMMDYVAGFAKTANPNGEDRPEWPRYAPDNPMRLHFKEPITVKPLGEKNIRRYNWYAERTLKEVLVGSWAEAIGGE